MASPKAIAATARRRVPLVDHLVRAFTRYQADSGNRFAAAVTYFWFLSLFPILLLTVSILGYALGADAEQQVVDGLGDQLPEGLAETLGETLTEAKGPAGIIGIIGLLFAGLGWVDALREAIRRMWHLPEEPGNIVVKKLRDVVVLVSLFAVVGASVAVTGVVTGFSDQVLDWLGLQNGPVGSAIAFAAGVALTLLADLVLFVYLFTRMARVRTSIVAVLPAAVFGAVGFEILKIVGGFYVARTTSRGEATYGAFAVVVGLLLFLYLLSRLILLAAVFAVTTKGNSDTAPSGTADQAVSPDRPLSIAPPPDAELAQWRAAFPPVREAHNGQDKKVVLAARTTAVAGGALLAGTGLYALNTVRGMLRHKD